MPCLRFRSSWPAVVAAVSWSACAASLKHLETKPLASQRFLSSSWEADPSLLQSAHDVRMHHHDSVAAAMQLKAPVLAQQVQPTSTTSHQSWFSKMGNAIVAVFVGLLVVIPLSIAVLWVNERRNARYESVIAIGEGECTTVEADKADEGNRGLLVHIEGVLAHGTEEVTDARFPELSMKDGCLRLRSTVEAFQWVETKETKEEKDNLGGGTTTRTTYTYSQEWSGTVHDSSGFNDTSRQNTLKKSMPLGAETKTCSLVHYGEAFVLPTELVEHLNDFQGAREKVGAKAGGFQHSEGEYYYLPVRTAGPENGDMRATLEYLPDCKASAVALQARIGDCGGKKSAQGSRVSFLPFRLVSRGFMCWRMDEETQKKSQIAEAVKTSDELYEADRASCGPLSCVFCCCLGICNLVNMCFSGLAPPQIYGLYAGEVSRKEVFKRIKSSASMQKHMIRFGGWLLLFVGFMMLLQPIFTAIDILPFVGPSLSGMVSFVAGLLALLLTAVVASLIISVAYLVYHPLLGFAYLLLTAAIVGAGVFIQQHLQAAA